MKTAAAKLGLKPDETGWVVGGTLEGFVASPSNSPAAILAFVADKAAVAPALDRVLPHYRRGGRLWFAYPKKSGSLASDISRDDGWEPLAAHDLLPVTQVALDSDWSALRFRYRDEIATLTRKF